ncbi:hypothetical protein O0I10_001191 [Lichtheimia ornata]|uniref:Uncharacterized protein n=1 Tax=Lichtheimia ornata TaxID=688661 RepID=A0AAD8DH07_9FUNG|nr:uncharacterized protein O0I10_001191 [Lichtheimia ornata]KAJ8663014.1 hypothetical protein O0I10_001191 [Lichtheimia ornata]
MPSDSSYAIHTLYQLKCRVAAGQRPILTHVMRAIQYEINHNHDYNAAEELFRDLLLMLNLERIDDGAHSLISSPLEDDAYSVRRSVYSELDIACFQKSIGKLIRAAPQPRIALKYVCYLFQLDPPMRNERIENTALIDVIRVYARARGEYLVKALDFVEIGVERGLAIPHNTRIKHHLNDDAFQVACHPILRHNRLRFSDDGTMIIPVVEHAHDIYRRMIQQ